MSGWQEVFKDLLLGEKMRDLTNGGAGGEYVTDDDGILWYASPGSPMRLVIPHSLIVWSSGLGTHNLRTPRSGKDDGVSCREIPLADLET